MRGPRTGCTPLSPDRGLKKKPNYETEEARCEPSSSQPALPHSLTRVTEPVLLTRGSLNIVKSPHQHREGKGGKMEEREGKKDTFPGQRLGKERWNITYPVVPAAPETRGSP